MEGIVIFIEMLFTSAKSIQSEVNLELIPIGCISARLKLHLLALQYEIQIKNSSFSHNYG